MKNKIVSVRIERVQDNDADTSWLGQWTDKAEDNAIIREGEHAGKFVSELGDDDELPSKGREYRFFLPAMTGDETGNPESPRQDWERMESLARGDWSFIGVIAKTQIEVAGVIQTIRSGGLWGIESDSSKEHLDEVGRDELADLKNQLLALGFGSRAVNYAFKSVETVNK